MSEDTYTLKASLLQAVVNNLAQQPAGAVRHLLNAIEAECQQQDAQRLQAAEQRLRADVEAQLRAELEASSLSVGESPGLTA